MKVPEETTPFDDPDVRLMLRLQGGDESAFEELIRRHQSHLHGLVYRYFGGSSLAEDVAQEVFLRVYRFRHRYQPTAKFTTWLFRIATNYCLNEIRGAKARPLVSDSVEERATEVVGDTPQDRLRRSEVQAMVREAIASLPEAQRMAVLLARFEDLSYDEIAETMGLSLEAVKSLLFRAKTNLSERLAPYVKDEGA